MTKKYKTQNFINHIVEVEVVKETECFVTIKTQTGRERREAKESSYYVYHDTYQQAFEYLLKRAKLRIEMARKELTKRYSELNDLESLR